MKILIADPIAPIGIDFLKEQTGFKITEAYGSTFEELITLIREMDALIVRSETKVTAELLEAAPNLKAIGRAGVGVDNIDIEAATEKGVVVLNSPSGNTMATTELTFTHMLCAARPIHRAHASMQNKEWNRKTFAGCELHGKTLGILGLGRIGTEVAKRAQAFGMQVLAHDPFLKPERAHDLGVELSTLDRLFTQSDYITVHMPLTERTKHIIDEAAIDKMKPNVRIFNCARGGIIKDSALLQGLKSGKVAAAGLDVFEEEPLPTDSEFRKLPNVILTPHLGASTEEAQASVGLEIAQSITNFFKKGLIATAVNMGSVDAKTLQFITPYLKLCTGLGTIVQQMAPCPIEHLKITYWGKIIEFDAMPLTRAILKGYLQKIMGKNINDINAPHKIKELGIEVEVTKSSTNASYTDLIAVCGIDAEGQRYEVQGTLFGKSQKPRIVNMNGHPIEANLQGHLLVLYNRDFPGMVGIMGTILGKDGVNIANMTLSRNGQGDTALTVYELDDLPSVKALENIKEHPDITDVKMIDI